MRIQSIKELLIPGTMLSKNEFSEIVRRIRPDYSERSVYWLLNQMQEMNLIQRLGRDRLLVLAEEESKPEYSGSYSPMLSDIKDRIKAEYPNLAFQAWELVQWNEFIRYEITENVYFVEVEHRMEKEVFRTLYQHYPRVLFCPGADSYYTYYSENMIVVQRLLSEIPKSKEDPTGCCLEKLLVDLFSNKLTGKLIDRMEYPFIYEEAFRKYQINEIKLFRYARRRNQEEEIRKFLDQKTNIRLISEEKNNNRNT